MIKFANIVSFLFGPMFILIPIPFILVSRFTGDYEYALKWTIFSYAFILSTAIFTALGVLFGVFSNFDVSKKEQRPLFFSFIAFMMSCYLFSLLILDGPKILLIGFIAILLGLTIIFFINKWIKASVHLATATSVFLFIGTVYKGYYFLFLFLIPLLAWSRVKMKEHTPMETVVGTILGIMITLIVYVIGKQFLLGMIYT